MPLDALARRYGLYVFDERLLRDMRDPRRRALLVRALEFKTEAELFPEWLARLLDFMFVSLIKFLPHQNREQAQAAWRLRHLLRFREETEGERYLATQEGQYRIVGEIDDSEM